MPDTRSSLIARLGDTSDTEAWREFAEIYEPFIYRQARRRGLQHADARELVQEVLIAVSQTVSKFQIDPQRGRFRSWLYAVGRNIILQRLGQIHRNPTSAGGETGSALQMLPDPSSETPRELSLELRRHVFLWAAANVRREFQPSTWKAFWMTAVENVAVARVAESMGVSIGSIYISRSRVMSRMRQRVQEITVDDLADLPNVDSTVPSDGSLSAEEQS